MSFRSECSDVTDSGDSDEADATDATDASSPSRRAYRLFVGVVRWLREFNRGHAGTSHLPHRDE